MHGMGVIIEINRDFPYQVSLSFDEPAIRRYELYAKLRKQCATRMGL